MRPMIPASLMILATLTACNGSSTPPVSVDDSGTTTLPTTTPPFEDTGFPDGDQGSLMVVNRGNETWLYGLFVNSHPGFINLAQCAMDRNIPCLTSLPDEEDDWKDFDPDREVDTEFVKSRFLGLQIEFAGEEMDYIYEPRAELGVYRKNISATGYPQGWIGSKLYGQWGERVAKKDLFVNQPIELQNPPQGKNIAFHDGQVIPIEWVPAGSENLILYVVQRFGITRYYNIEDDGYFELNVDDLGLGSTPSELTFTLQRLDTADIRYRGHQLEYVASSEAVFTGDYFFVGSRDPIDPPDECTEARGSQPLQPGNYWGRLGGSSNNLSPATCGVAPVLSPSGGDSMIKITLEPKELLSVEYTLTSEDGAVYVVEDCTNENTCVAGANTSEYPGDPELVTMFNAEDITKSWYLVVDGTTSSNSIYTLDINQEPLEPPVAADTCELAGSIGNSGAGVYYDDFVAYTSSMNPGAGGCTGTSLTGPEFLTRVSLAAGAELSASISMPEGDPALYVLLASCNNPTAQCVSGADASLDGKEGLIYTNDTQAAQDLFVVVDSKSSLAPYFLTLTITP